VGFGVTYELKLSLTWTVGEGSGGRWFGSVSVGFPNGLPGFAIEAKKGRCLFVVMSDDYDFSLHDGREPIAVLRLKFPEIPTPNKNSIMVEAQEVVRFLGGPGYENILMVDTGSGGRETIELVVGVYLRREVFLPKYFTRLGIQAKDELFAIRLAGASGEEFVVP
jgi:hypothetical protein